MSLEDDFSSAKQRVNKLPSAPSTQDLLELYALYKQATAGDVTGKRPGISNFRDRAKYDAWQKKKGLAKDHAMQEYIDKVSKLVVASGKG